MLPKTISIRLNLTFYFLVVVTLVASVLIGVEYHFSNRLAVSAAETTFKLTSENLRTYITQKNSQMDQALTLLGSQSELISENIKDDQTSARQLMTTLMRNNDGLYAVYLGRQNDDFYQIINVQSDQSIKRDYQTGEDTRWLEILVTGRDEDRTRYIRHLNDELETLKEVSETSRYYPSIRPWYLKAQFKDEMIQTSPYWFSGIDGAGITLARRTPDLQGVFGIDLTMHAYNAFLKSQTSSVIDEIFLFDSQGLKFATSKNIDLQQTDNTPQIETQKIALTQEEQEFIRNNPIVTVSNEMDYPPIDFAIQGKPAGYSVDLLKLLEAKTGLHLTYINGLKWSELVDLYKMGKLDILQSAFVTEERKKIGVFSEPMLTMKSHLIIRKEDNFKSLADLSNRSVGVIKGWSTFDYLKDNFPSIQVKTYDTPIENYIAVSRGEVDAAIDTELAMAYYAEKLQLNNLKISDWVNEFDEGTPKGLHMLIQLDKRIIQNIFNKALASITESERQLLDNKWLKPSQNAQNDESRIPRELLYSAILDNDELTEFTLSKDGQQQAFFGYTANLYENDKDIQFGISANTETLTAPYFKQVVISLYIAFVVVLFSFLLVKLATSRILKPISALMVENEKVRNRQFKKVRQIDSRITEFHDLSKSLIDMSSSIQAYEKSQEELMESLIQLIADAIDAKSPYTGGHCNRVPFIAMQLAQTASESTSGPFAAFKMDGDDEKREFRIGAWLHDCGKVITPEHVVDKATKLETIYNRIHEIRTRFEVIWRDVEIRALQRRLDGADPVEVESWLNQQRQQLQEDYSFIAECNIGGEFMSPEMQDRVRKIAEIRWQRNFTNLLGLSNDEERRLPEEAKNENLPVEEKLLDDKVEHVIPREAFDYESYEKQGFKTPVPDNLFNKGEVYNLCIARGTLTEEERYKINEHVIMTIKMLEKLPLPENLSRVPEYAGTHHETMIGTGYPRQLTADELSIPARIMVLADVFEALTASDRPYKKGKKLSEALKILGFMVKDQHIDPDVFELFLKSGIYMSYCENFLDPKQIDEIDINDYLPKRD